MEVSSRLLGLLDQQPLAPGDPLYLQTLCETWRLLVSPRTRALA